MAGRVPAGSQRSAVAREMENTFIRNLRYAADVLSEVGLLLCPTGSTIEAQLVVINIKQILSVGQSKGASYHGNRSNFTSSCEKKYVRPLGLLDICIHWP